MARVLFGMIDNRSRPIGGVKVIYQAVAGLRRRGIDAYVASAVGLAEWLQGSELIKNVALVDMSRPQAMGPRDLFVATDSIGPHRLPFLLGKPDRRILFIQNHNALQGNPSIDWSLLTHIRCLTVSEFSRRFLIDRAGFRDVAVVHPGVDRTVFRPAGARRHRIAYMPRKWPGLAEKLQEKVRQPIEWLPIDGRTEMETAALLAGSSIFLNLGRGEGFGLPPLEAMAAGCVVCGFAGQGTTDFATPDNGFWVGEDDLGGCVQAIDEAMDVFRDPERVNRYVTAGRLTAERFALPVFEDRMADYFRALL